MKIFKYNREDDYFLGNKKYNISPLKDKIDEIFDYKGYDFKKELLAKKMSVYSMTRPALNVNHLPVIQKIINQINSFLDYPDRLEIDVYINRQETPDAKATINRQVAGQSRELIIILSQHFMNELNYNEKLAVISHEVAHFLYEHTNIPYRKIIKRYSGSQKVEDRIFVQNLKKWSICKEISADLLSLQLTKNYESTALALIKYSTGIMKQSNDVLRDLESHFGKLKNNNHCEVLKEHPLTLLRVLILKRVSEFFKENGWKSSPKKVQKIINEEMSLIYPEIVFDKNMRNVKISIELGLLVGIADGKIDEQEIKFLNELCYSHQQNFNIEDKAEKLNCKITEDSKMSNFEKAWVHIFKEIPKICKKAKKIKDLHISSIIRNLLTLAASDGKIDSNELKVIYLFAKEFDYSKGDIIKQMFNIK